MIFRTLSPTSEASQRIPASILVPIFRRNLSCDVQQSEMISSLVSWRQLFGCHRIRQVQAGKARDETKEAEELAGN